MWAYAILLNNDQIIERIGSIESALPLVSIPNSSPDQVDLYVVFPNLEISSQGNFHIRIIVMELSGVGAVSLEEVDGRIIIVDKTIGVAGPSR